MNALEKQIAELEKREKTLKDKKQLLLNKQKKQSRKDDTRRKILIGAWMIEQKGLGAIVKKMNDLGAISERDRELFLLEPKKEKIHLENDVSAVSFSAGQDADPAKQDTVFTRT